MRRHLKAELHSAYFCERFVLILEEFLAHCPREALELRKQNNAVLKLQKIAELIVKLKREDNYGDAEAMKEYQKEIEKINRDLFQAMGKFQIPYKYAATDAAAPSAYLTCAACGVCYVCCCGPCAVRSWRRRA